MTARAIVLASLLCTCKGSAERTPQPAAAPSPTPPAASGSASKAPDPLEEKMRHCPVTVPGVTTGVADVDGGVQLTLHATDPTTVAEVRKRAREMVDFSTGHGQDQKHGDGRGGGFMRNCPVVARETTIAVQDTDDGARVTVTPRAPSGLAALRAATRDRLARAPIERARVVRAEASSDGEVRLYSGAIGDLDGDGALEMVAGGFSAEGSGRRSTVRAYRQRGDAWVPIAEAGWDDGAGSTVRNVQVADVDGDGRLDIVVVGKVGATSHEAKARVAVFDLVGDKLVRRAETEWRRGQYTHGYGLAIADLDGDRRAEIVTSGFQLDGTRETGYVRVWSMVTGALALRAEVELDGAGSPSMRVNDLAVGDLDGDGRLELLVAGRHGPLKTEDSKEHLDQRREIGELDVLRYAGGRLAVVTRYSWAKGTTLRVRSLVAADLDGDHRDDIVAGGQYDTDGKACLALFGFRDGKLVLRDDASATTTDLGTEIKDLVVAGSGPGARVLAAGVIGDKPGRQGSVAAWRLERDHLVRSGSIVSRNGEETRARSLVVLPGTLGASVLTIGHARTGATTMIGQVLRWDLAGAATR